MPDREYRSVLVPRGGNATGNFTKVVQRLPMRISLYDAPDTLQVGPSVEATVDTTGREAHPQVATGTR